MASTLHGYGREGRAIVVRRVLTEGYQAGRKLVVAVVGTTLVVVGIAMIVLPGPAIIVIPLGLGILGIEFAWARRYLRNIKERSGDALDRLRGTPAARGSAAPRTPDGDLR